ncbi:hypothetical protein AB4072_14840 [Microvirga sp. 2MCAF38]|uniref:hypothetical protein n=1 Tax=Microvirga sp. 2MCAF38 TaxID=3232989 RepID=UPI003F98455C
MAARTNLRRTPEISPILVLPCAGGKRARREKVQCKTVKVGKNRIPSRKDKIFQAKGRQKEIQAEAWTEAWQKKTRHKAGLSEKRLTAYQAASS